MHRNLWVVARREFRETVRKKSFVILTILMPVLFGGLMVVPSLLISRSTREKKVVLLDATGALKPGILAALKMDDEGGMGGGSKGLFNIEIRTVANTETESTGERELVRTGELDALIIAPADIIEGGKTATYYSRSATDLVTRRVLGSALNHAVMEKRVGALGVDTAAANKLLERVELNAVQITKSGETKRGGDMDFLLAFAFAALMFIPTIYQGQEILRGVIQEKSDRIVESLVSAIRPFDLLTGKVFGLAAVGLVQIGIWMVMGFAISIVTAGPMLAAGASVVTLITPAKLVYFVIFFLLCYTMLACVYAAGGACVNSEKEAQQVLMPVMMILMVPWFLMMPIVMDPESRLAVVLSLFPLFTPLTMFARIVVGQPPGWQIALSIVLAVLSDLALFWAASRIYRVGILSYGKRPTLPEFLRWMRQE